MKVQAILAAAVLAGAMSTGASAATMHTMKHVAPKSLASPTAIALEKQYAKAAPKHKGDLFYKWSQWYEARGIELANQGYNLHAEWDLRTALLKIGEWPQA
ncbi:MAG TPA: hypothetical protein VG651_18410 [Stellaceae bacterium]|nr:hypothetical protein [Bauldia sp.]HWB51090.1 hypothetical protein [Stellaceae bacterium]